MKTILNQIANKIKSVFNRVDRRDFLVVALIILSSGASFGLGILASRETPDSTVYLLNRETSMATAVISKGDADIVPDPESQQNPGKYVASKNGTRYYLPWCSGVSRIAEANKIWFNTKEEAEARGLTPAANCKGI